MSPLPLCVFSFNRGLPSSPSQPHSFDADFCVASGLGLGCGIELGSLSSWALLWDAQAALRALPTLGCCALVSARTGGRAAAAGARAWVWAVPGSSATCSLTVP